MSVKRVGILRGGPLPRRNELWPREGGTGNDYYSSLEKGGEIISHIFENLGEKYKTFDILVDNVLSELIWGRIIL